MTRSVMFTGDIFRQQPRGGITRYVIEIARRLRRPGEVVLGVHQSVEVVSLRVPVRSALRIPPWRIAHRIAALVNGPVDAMWFWRRRNPILHPTYYRDPRGLPPRAPVVVTVYDMTHERLAGTFPARGARSYEPARFKADLCRRAERILCISESTRRDVVDLLGVPDAKTRTTLLAGRDWSDVFALPIAGVRRPFVLWVGERHAYKNFGNSLAAWAACKAARETTLLCVGGGGWRRHERDAVIAAGAADRVHQRSCSDGELRWAYENASALLYASLWEGFGMPMLEALSLGCPVLASDRAAFLEVAGDAAVLAEPTDRDALTSGLAAALAQGRGSEWVAKRRARAACFSWDACAARHEAVYRELD